MTRRCRTAMLGTACALAVALPAYSQSANRTPPTTAKPNTTSAAQAAPKTSMSMDDMMKQCRDHCTQASKSMDDTMKMMSDAKTSNDATKMRAALDQTQKQMTDMKTHMTMCMNMMDMMQKMGGMMKK